MKLLRMIILLGLTSFVVVSQAKDFFPNRKKGLTLRERNLKFFELTGRCRGCNLSGLDLREAINKNHGLGRTIDLSGANLSGANLSGTDLSDFSGKILSGFSRARLGGAKLYEADLSGTNLTGQKLVCAMLFGAKLTGADLSEVDFRYANLTKSDLSNAQLFETNFEGSFLGGACFDGAWIDSETNFDQARSLLPDQLKKTRSIN